MSAPAGVHDLHRLAGTIERGVDINTQETVTALVEALRRAAFTDGPSQAEYLLATVADDVARATVEDPMGLAIALAEEHRTLEERRRSWDERNAAWQQHSRAALREIIQTQQHLEGILHELAATHRRRTREATLVLPGGSAVKTQESKQIDVKISDAGAFMAAVKGREDLPAGMITNPDPVLALVAAKAYAKAALKGGSGELLPGVEAIPAGRITSVVSHEAFK